MYNELDYPDVEQDPAVSVQISDKAARPTLERPDDLATPVISVIIATCNRPQTLLETIRSVFAQEGPAVEVIVIDDSKDHTAAGAVDQLADARIRYVVNPKPSNGRPAIARNIGVRLARGAFIHFLDDDDMVPAGYHAEACAVFAAKPSIGAVFGTIEPFGEDAAEIVKERAYFADARNRARRCARLGSRWVFTAAMLFGPTLLVCSAGMIRREQVAALGGFNPAMPLVEDVDFYMRAIRAGRVHFLDRPALHYRIGPSLMRQADRGRLLEDSSRESKRAYREQRGTAEFLMLKILAKVLRLT